MEEKEVIKRRGLVKKHAAIDYEVWQWKINEEKRRGSRIIKSEIQAFAVDAYKRRGVSNFKASDGWYRRWRVRWQTPGVVCSQIFNAKDQENVESMITNKSLLENVTLQKNDQLIPEEVTCTLLNPTPELELLDQNPFKGVKDGNKQIIIKAKSISGLPIEDCESSGVLLNDKRIVPVNVVSTLVGTQSVTNIHSNLNQTSVNSLEQGSNLKTSEQSSTSIDTNELFNVTSIPYLNQIYSPSTDILSHKDITSEHSTLVLCNLVEPGKGPGETLLVEVNRSDANGESIFNQIDKTCKDSENQSNLLIELKTSQSDRNGFSEKQMVLHSELDPCASLRTIETSETLYSASTKLYDERDIDYGDHEFFCDSCEDFHPRGKGRGFCCGQPKLVKDNLFLNCDFQKREFNQKTDLSISNKADKKLTSKIKSSTEANDRRLVNPSVVLSKGKRYLLQFKSKVVNYALSHNVKKAVAKFKVNRGTVSDWLSERKKSLRGTSTTAVVEVLSQPYDSEFLTWLEESKFNLTNELIKQKVSEWLEAVGPDAKRCRWLNIYAHRLNGTEETAIKKCYIAYPDAFKRVAVFHSQTHSNLAAARVFGVARRRIAEWTGYATGDMIKPESSFAKNVTDESVDKQVFEWYRTQNPPPTSRQVREKAVGLYREAGHVGIQCKAQWYYRWRARHGLPPARIHLSADDALLSWALGQLDNNQSVTHSALTQAHSDLGLGKVSRGWTFRFCRRHERLLQSQPEPTAPVPASLQRRVLAFRRELLDEVRACGIQPTHIVAMDEVPLHVLPKDDSKKKPLLVRKPGFQSCQASLVISCLSDGTLLPSLFVFKGVAPTCECDPQVISVVSDSGLVNETILDQWLQRIFFKHIGEANGALVMDCFDLHSTEEVQETLAQHKVYQAVTPAGCAFKLMPVIKLGLQFKRMLEDMCQAWSANQVSLLTSPSPSPDQLYSWAVRTHRHLASHQPESLRTAFKEMLCLPSAENLETV